MINILVVDFIIVLMIFLRLTAAFLASPIFNHRAFPMSGKLFLALVISYMIFLSIDKSNIHVQASLWFLFTNAVKEIITGLILGFMLNLVFYGISYAGTLIGFDMGLTMAQVFNPMEEANNNVLGQFLYMTAIVILLLINGHHYIIRGLAYSFTIVPIGKFTINQSVFSLLIRYSAAVFIIAVKIASPILVSFFLIHIGEGIIARVIPQMQVFFITQPLKIGVGLILLASIVPIYVYVIKNLLQSYEKNLFTLIRAMGT